MQKGEDEVPHVLATPRSAKKGAADNSDAQQDLTFIIEK